jgi:integrase
MAGKRTLRLTQLAVEKVRPVSGRRLEIHDGPAGVPGLALRVTDRGVRSYTLMYRVSGRQRRLTLGRHPVMSLTDARLRAREALQLVERGIDPAASRAEERRERERNTVRVVAEEYIARHLRKNTRRWRDAERMLQGAVLPSWGDRPAKAISRRDVLDLVDDIADRAPVMANRVLSMVRRLFAWGIARGIVDTNPADGVRPPHRENARDRVLTDPELAAIWRACVGLGFPFGSIVRLLALTGQRRSEVAAMRWSQVDLDRRLWTLPPESTKSARAHVVPLSEAASAILKALPRLAGELVFPARIGSGPASGFSAAKLRLDALSGVAGWRLHDLRRTAASGMARLGHPPHVVSAILNHAPGATLGPVSAIYNRHLYLDERHRALEAWARHVEQIAEGREATVVSLRRAD